MAKSREICEGRRRDPVTIVALIDDGFQTPKCIYNIAYAYYKLGKLRQSRLFCERLLKLDPLNQQAQDLHQQLDSIVQQSGVASRK